MILVHLKKKHLLYNFDQTPRGRSEVQKNKWTPDYQTELNGKSEKNNRFMPRELLFLTKYRLKKNTTLNHLFLSSEFVVHI